MTLIKMQEVPYPQRTISGSFNIIADTINTNFISTVTATGGGGAIQPQLTVYSTAGSGTYTTPVGATYLIVECLGGGGGGANNGAAAGAFGGGGGAGAYYRKQFTAPAASYSYTVGAGGVGTPAATNADGSAGSASTFGGMSAAGGAGGKKGATAADNGDGGAGGSTYTGLVSEIIKIDGGTGGTGTRSGGVGVMSGFGGGATTGFGPSYHRAFALGKGGPAVNHGGGGGGSYQNNGEDGRVGRISVLAYF